MASTRLRRRLMAASHSAGHQHDGGLGSADRDDVAWHGACVALLAGGRAAGVVGVSEPTQALPWVSSAALGAHSDPEQYDVPGDLFLVTQDAYTGRPLLGEPVRGLALAAARLCELMLWGLVNLNEAGVLGVTRRPVPGPHMVSLVERIRGQWPPHGLRDWLAALRLSATDTVRDQLVEQGVLQRKTRLVGRRVTFHPVEVTQVAWGQERLRILVTQGSPMSPAERTLVGLLYAVGLADDLLSSSARGDRAPVRDQRQLTVDLPADVCAVIAAVEIAVGQTVLAPRR